MIVSSLHTYPVKSLSGISLDGTNVLSSGFDFDRQWMLVDVQGKFLTQRNFPKMALIHVHVEPPYLKFWHARQPENQLFVPVDPPSSSHLEVSIWNDVAEAWLYPKSVNDWFSEILKSPCQLVKKNPHSPRKSRLENTQIKPIAFADSQPVLMICQASLDDLNSRLPQPVPMNRFRPNIVIDGTEPYAEDLWQHVLIGSLRWKIVKPCERCVLTTIDQETGAMSKEPLWTLNSYRAAGNKTLFGVYAMPVLEGSPESWVIQKGDFVKLSD